MQPAMIGLGRMGANMVRRLLRADHEYEVFDSNREAVRRLAAEGRWARTRTRIWSASCGLRGRCG